MTEIRGGLMMSTTVIGYLLAELKRLGIRDIFGVPGDYAFPIDNAIDADPALRWIGCCNELNAAYAADGYARMRGISALCTTFGVGELSAVAGIAGAYAEHLPVIHLVGMPPTASAANRRVLHHTLGTGKFQIYAKMQAPVTAAWTILNQQNAVSEIRRVLTCALYERRPVYLGLPMDQAHLPIVAPAYAPARKCGNRTVLKEALSVAAEKINRAKTPVVLPGYMIRRLHLQEAAYATLKAGNLPFATMMMDKCVLSEHSPHFLGIYDGHLLPGKVQTLVERSDCLLNLGAIWSDFNTGSFTARIRQEDTIAASLHQVSIGNVVYHDIELADFVEGLAKLLKPHKAKLPGKPEKISGAPEQSDFMDSFYHHFTRFLKKNDILVTDTGTPLFGIGTEQLPEGCVFLNQTLWGAIGWATPAAFGAALAAPERRVILLTGEGAHQMTVQEISQLERHGLTPLIFVVNNNGYQIERVLDDNPNRAYNDLPAWDYPALAAAFGNRSFLTGRIRSLAEWQSMRKKLEKNRSGAYLEIISGQQDVPAVAKMLGEFRKTMYS